jgi:hypothetical protein
MNPSKTGPEMGRDEKGRITKGTVLNPAGRGAAGSKTAAQLQCESIVRANAPDILAEAIRRGLKGSDVLLSKLVDKLLPPATRVLDLSSLPDALQTPADASAAALACAGLLQSGEITTAELSALVEVFTKLGDVLSGLKHQKLVEQFD